MQIHQSSWLLIPLMALACSDTTESRSFDEPPTRVVECVATRSCDLADSGVQPDGWTGEENGPTGDEGPGQEPPPRTDADCVAEVEVGEAIVPTDGWSSWITLPERYSEPEIATPAIFHEGTDCVEDPRPAFEWCKKYEYGPDGVLKSSGPRQRPLADLPTFEPGEYRKTLRQGDGYPFDELWVVGERGNVVEWRRADGISGDVFQHWRLRFSCDGRPVRYDALIGDAPPPFLYDSHGRPTRLIYPRAWALQSWHDDGRLRARHTFRDDMYVWLITRQHLDEQGRLVADEYTESLNMGDTVVTTLFDPRTRTMRTLVDYPRHDDWRSSVTRKGAAPDGRPRLTWEATEPGSDPQKTIRSVARTTLTCATGAPVKDEVDHGADGTIDEFVHYVWLPESRKFRATSTTGAWTDYHLSCD